LIDSDIKEALSFCFFEQLERENSETAFNWLKLFYYREELGR